jgi:2',3'-cyclic-nucleotide 2'-phosphodiesterase (5'-nucleotidase family)
MVALKPLSGIGNTISKFTGLTQSFGKLSFLHTMNLNSNDHKAIRYINEIKSRNRNTILLNAGRQNESGFFNYDASVNASDDLLAMDREYKIVTKGNATIGVITATPGEKNIVQKIKILSTRLKNEKNCSLVVCLSQLGYKNKRSPDDITLAKETTDLDIIIGGHEENFHVHPIVALNNKNAEVIIHSAAGNTFAFGKIEIDFDEMGRKNQVSFGNSIARNAVSKKSKAVA